MSIERAQEEGKRVDSQLMAEAERWLVRLDGGACSSAERGAFNRWLAVPAHAAAYEEAERAWSVFGQLADRADLQRLSGQTLAETAPDAKRPLSRRLSFALAASLAVCVLAAAAFFAGQRYTPTRTYVTDVGQRSTIQLDDGSQVVLNFGTRLEVKFGNDRRQFDLKSGEAVFTVAQDPLRPFTVFAGGTEVTALGTRFQVRNDARRVTVTLLEGRIAVDRGSTRQHVQLNPGEQVRIAAGAAEITRQSVDPVSVSSWTTGRLKFNATPLVEVIEEVNRYSKMKIRLQDAAFAQTPVSGVFDIGDMASVVSAIETMLPVEATPQDHREVLLIRK